MATPGTAAPAASTLRRVVGHQPFIDHRAFVGHQRVTRCRECRWAQVADEDLHEHRTDPLSTWHVEHPEHGLDYLTGDDLVGALQVPLCVRWTANEGLLDLVEGRTGGRHGGYSHAGMAVFRSAADGRPLQDAVAVAASMHQRGLLQPRPTAVAGLDRGA
jgi:hypothetical protein